MNDGRIAGGFHGLAKGDMLVPMNQKVTRARRFCSSASCGDAVPAGGFLGARALLQAGVVKKSRPVAGQKPPRRTRLHQRRDGPNAPRQKANKKQSGGAVEGP